MKGRQEGGEVKKGGIKKEKQAERREKERWKPLVGAAAVDPIRLPTRPSCTFEFASVRTSTSQGTRVRAIMEYFPLLVRRVRKPRSESRREIVTCRRPSIDFRYRNCEHA